MSSKSEQYALFNYLSIQTKEVTYDVTNEEYPCIVIMCVYIYILTSLYT